MLEVKVYLLIDDFRCEQGSRWSTSEQLENASVEGARREVSFGASSPGSFPPDHFAQSSTLARVPQK